MKSLVVYEKKSKEVLASVSLDGDRDAIIKDDVEFVIKDDDYPCYYFDKTDGKIKINLQKVRNSE